ncbi:MAG: hypothetical protein JNK00_03610 [Flavipsychrobacter sp.]|nr:hypothetical protein [Flavipsychrobacter sp.]
MRQYIIALLSICLLSACEGGWDSESKELFHKSCIEDAKSVGKDEAAAKSMCDCRLEKIMKKYPNVDDALMNIEQVIKDPEVQACK